MAITLPTDSQNPLLTTAEDATKAVPSIEEEQRRAFEGAVIGPERERQEAKREEIAAWSAKRVKKIDDALLNFDEFMPNKRPEVKRRFLVKKAIELHAGVEPDNIDLHRMARAQWGRKLFGQETDTDEAFLAAMTKQAQERKEEADFTSQILDVVQDRALGGDKPGQMTLNEIARDHPVYKKNPAKYAEVWKESQSRFNEEYGDVLPSVRKLRTLVESDDVSLVEIYEIVEGATDEQLDRMASLIGWSIQRAGEKGEERGFWDNLITTTERGGSGLGDQLIRQINNMIAGQFQRAAEQDESIRGERPENQAFKHVGEEWEKRMERASGFVAEIRRYRDMRDPIKLLADEDSVLGHIESAVYQIPTVGMTVGASAVPFVGWGATAGMLYGSVADDYYLHVLDKTGDRQEAREISAKVAPWVAAAQFIPERLGLAGIKGRIPFLDKALSKLPAAMTGKAGSLVAGTTVRALAETGTEEIQAILQEMGRDTLQWFNSEIPGADWDAHWGNFGWRNFETFLAIAPYSALGAFAKDRGLEKAIARAREATRNQKIAAGFDPAPVDRFDNAKTPFEERSAFAEMVKSQDPDRPATKEAAKKEAEITQRRAETAEQLRRYQASPGIRFDPEREGVEVYDAKTGETLANVANFEEASRVVYAIIEGDVDERSSVFQEINSILEAAQIDVEDSGKALEVELRTFTESDMLNEFPEAEARFGVQSELLEQRDGGTGEVTKEVMGEGGRRIRGLFIPAGNLGRRSDVTKLFGGSSVLTLIHERAHQKRRALMKSGAWSRDQQVSSIKALDSLIQKSIERDLKKIPDSKKETETFLPANFDSLSPEKQEVALDEAVSELAEVLALNSRGDERSTMRGLISKNLRAMTKNRIPGAAQLAAFMRAMKEYFGIQLRRAAVLKTAVRQGKLNQGQIDKLTDMLIGKTDQESFNEESDAVPTQMVDGEPVDVPFSIGLDPKPYKDRSGDEQGEPLTETEIEEGIEDEPGTIGDVEVDDEAFADLEKGAAFSIASDVPLIERESLKGKKKFVYFSDQTRVGKYKGLDPQSGINIDLQGGPLYPYIEGHGGDAGWAFTTEGMFTRFQKRVDETDGIGLTTLYSKENLRANPTFLQAYAAEVEFAISSGKLSRSRYLAEMNKLRTALKKSAKWKKDSSWAEKFNRAWKAPEEVADALSATTFEVRASMFFGYDKNKKGANKGSKIGADSLVAQGFPNISDMVDLFADPAFDGLEQGTIVGAIQFEQGQKKSSRAEDIGAEKHLSYPIVTKGKGIGLFTSPIHVTKVLKGTGKEGRALTRSAETSMAKLSFSLSPAQDAEYLKAVESGDMETAQEMVDEAARSMTGLFHGGTAGGAGHVVLFAESVEDSYWNGGPMNGREGLWELTGETRNVSNEMVDFAADYFQVDKEEALELLQPPDIVNSAGAWDDPQFVSDFWQKFEGELIDDGDAIRTPDGAVSFPESPTFEPVNTDPVSYDDQGNVIPLSERFNESSDEISFDITIKEENGKPVDTVSFSLSPARDAEYLSAVEAGDMDKAQKMADEAANPLLTTKPSGKDSVLRVAESFEEVLNDHGLMSDWRRSHSSSSGSSYFEVGPLSEWDQDWGFSELKQEADIFKVRIADHERQLSSVLNHKKPDFDTSVHGNALDAIRAAVDFWADEEGVKFAHVDPVTYDEDGNVIPLSERFNEQDDRISFDIGDGKVITGLLENVGRRGGKPEVRAKIFADLARRFRELKRDVSRIKQAFGKDYEEAAIVDPRTMKSLRKERNFRQADKEKELTEQGESPKEAKTAAKAFADAWLEDAIAEQKRDNSQEAQIRRSLVLYDAILKALPPEIRGKLGGFVALSKLRTNEKRLEFLEKKIDQADEVIEKWLIKQQRKQIDKMFDSARPKKNAKGIIKARLNAEQTDQIADIESLALMPKQDLDEEIEKLEETIQNSTDQDAIDEATTELVRLMAFGNIDGKSSVELEEFFQNLSSIFYTGKMLKEFSDDQFRQLADGMKEIVNKDVTGGGGRLTSSEAKAKEKSRKLFRGLSKFHRKNLSFEWLMNQISRENKDVGTLDSDTHKAFSVEVHKATHREKRANLAIQKRYQDILSRVFGGVKGLALTKKISGLMEEQENTGVIKMDYDGNGAFTIKKARASNVRAVIEGKASLDSLEMTKEEFASAKAKFEELTKIAQDRENSRAAKAKRSPQKVSLNGNRLIEYESPNVGKPDNLTLSQSQAINLLMLYRQKDLKESMIKEGYSEETMKQMEAWLSPEGKQIRDWLSEEYDTNYDTINEVFKRNNGVSLPKTEFYSPARRIADGTVKDMAIDSSGNTAMSTAPNFLISRVKNFAEVDQTADALSLYIQHMVQTNHYVEWADTVKMLRTVFGDKTVKKNISDYAGSDLLSLISERIQWFADGGNRKATHISWMDKLRAAHTYSSLSYNWTVMIKQLTSLPAYAFDMGLGDFTKYAAKFMANPVKNLKEMMEEDYVKTRFKEGYERDVIDGLKREGGRFTRALKAGMILGKAGDIVPVMIGGWMAKKRSYDQAIADGMTKAQAEAKSIIDFEMATDRAQQAGDLKDLSSFQGGGSLFKLFTMYKTSPRQYYANVYESFLDAKAGKKGARKEFIRRLFIGHVILPLSFQFVSDLLKSPFDDEDDFEFENYLRAVLLGPLNGLFIMGDAAELIFSGLAGTKIWPEKVPILDGYELLSKGIDSLKDGDLGGAIDKLARGTGKITPGPVTFYDIIRKELRRFDVID